MRACQKEIGKLQFILFLEKREARYCVWSWSDLFRAERLKDPAAVIKMRSLGSGIGKGLAKPLSGTRGFYPIEWPAHLNGGLQQYEISINCAA